MAPVVIIFHAICFLLLQIIDVNVAMDESSMKYDNTTNYASKWNSAGRSKRALYDNMPRKLRIRVKYATGEESTLNWVRKVNYLANQHLPVYWFQRVVDLSVMEKVGEFVLYHDLEACSSVVYFQNTHTFIGHVGMNYVIDELPFKFDANGNYPDVVGAPYVMKYIEQSIPVQPTGSQLSLPIIDEDFPHSLEPTHQSDGGNKRPSDPVPGPSTKHQRTERDLNNGNYEELKNPNVSNIVNIRKRRWNPIYQKFYLETLVFITADVAELFENYYGMNIYVPRLVRYCIRYFNAVDTFFQKVRGPHKINMNIAAIVFVPNLEVLDSRKIGEIQFTETVAKLRKYISGNRIRFTPDSFDHIFLITNHQIMHNSVRVPGMTDHYADLYEKRDEGLFYEAVPITIVEFSSSYVQGVHQISRTLNIRTEPSVEIMESTGRCYSVMQEGSSMCNRCLRWSEESEQQFLDFSLTNYNRCFLLNQPRSLRPPGPSIFLTLNRQCQCFGYDSFAESRVVRSNECKLALHCRKENEGQMSYGYILPPFDGTRCGGAHKVCWNGECVPVNRKPCQ